MSRPRSRAKATTAIVPEVDSRLADRRDEFLRCGDFGHRWESPDGEWQVHERSRGGVPQQVFREVTCSRCETVRKDIYRLTPWTRLTPSYHYPEGYRLPPSDGRPALHRTDMRYALFVRGFKGDLDIAAG